MFGLHTDDAHLRSQVFDVCGDACDQSTPPHRHKDRVEACGVLTQDLHGDSALPRDHLRVVEWRNKGTACARGQVQGVCQGKRKAFTVQHGLGATASHPQHLQFRRRGGHDDGRSNSQFPRCQRHTLCVVAGRRGDHSACFLLITQLHQLVISTADLEGKRRLQVLAFQQDLVTQGFRQRGCRLQWRTYGQFVNRRREYFLYVLGKQGLLVGGVGHLGLLYYPRRSCRRLRSFALQ